MYLALYRFGPRWDLDYIFYCEPGGLCGRPEEGKYHLDIFTPPFDNKQFQEIADKVKLFNLLNEEEQKRKLMRYKDQLESYFKEDVEEYLDFTDQEPIYVIPPGAVPFSQ